jgi:hypothetical protein
MKADPTLTRNVAVRLEGVLYDRYSIEGIEWKLSSNTLYVKVDYTNITQSKYTSRAWPVEAGAEVNVNQVIETIHQLHEKIKA